MAQAKNIATTLLRVFLAAAVSTILTGGLSLLTMGKADWLSVANAGLTAVLTAAMVWLDPSDGRYGVGAGS